MLEPNKLMTWKEMVSEYPGMWVIVEQTEGDDVRIDAGIVRYVATDDEMPEIWIKCRKSGLGYVRERTTVDSFVGIVDGVDFIIDSQEVFGSE